MYHKRNRLTYNKPTGTNNEPTTSAGILISGVPLPLFLSANYSEACKQLTECQEMHKELTFVYILFETCAPNIVADINPKPSPM